MKKIVALLCALLVMGGSAQALEVSAPSALLMEKETGTVLFAKDEHAKLEPASVTKVMTLLLTMEAIDSGALHYDDVITASAHACSMGGSQIWLKENEQMTVSDMLKAVCVVSANDCAVALAETVAGSEEAFVERMNERAKDLGMKNTHFVDCCGLTESQEHYTTPYDIALMSRELISRYPEVLTYSSVWMEDITHVTRKGSSKFTLTNTNKLLRSYEGCMGLKTGSTSIAKYCLSAVAERNGITLIASVMAAPDPKTRFRDAAALLNYGFSKCTLYLDDALEPLKPMKLRKGVKEQVPLVYRGKFRYISTDGTKPDNVKKKLILPKEQSAPVKKGQKAGAQEYYQDGKKIGSLDILYGETIKKAGYHDWLERTCQAFLL